jgi:signal transduction histidine kinase
MVAQVMRSAPGTRKRFPRTELRLALQMLALAALVCVLAGWLAWQQVRATLEDGLRDDLRQMREAADGEVEALREHVAQDLADAEKSLREDTIAMQTILLAGAVDPSGTAAGRHRGTLELFEILDGSGSVLSSVHEPARVAMPSELLRNAPDGRPVLLSNDTDPTAPLLIAGGRVFQYGSRTLRLRGGIALSSQLLDRVARGERALLVRAAGGAPVIASTAAAELADVAPTWISLDRTASAAPGVEAPPDRRWLVDIEALYGETPPDEASAVPLAYLVYAVDRSRMTSHLAHMSRSFVVLGSVVGVFAALIGVTIARSVGRPVDEVVQAFDAIAEGRADYTFDVGSRDAMRELPAAFSRTHRALELQRRRSAAAERVAAWREVAQHLAHEVKNPLVPIRLTVENLTLARRQAPDRFPRMFDDGMRTILEEVQQLSRIVSEFSEFARLPLPAPRPTDLGPLIDRAIELHAAEPGLKIERRIDPETPVVSIDPDLVSRALKNVVANAVDAVLEGAARTGLEPRIEIGVRLVEGMAEIEIADNGPGLSDESARHIFEPYFTTKPDGTGLGMTLTYRIIVDHGGTIVAENRHEGGARVVIRLPCEIKPAGTIGRASEVRA